MSYLKSKLFCGFSRKNPLIAYKLGCSRAKTQGDKAIFLEKGVIKKNGEIMKPTLSTHSHILLDNCGYTAYICELRSCADSALKLCYFDV